VQRVHRRLGGLEHYLGVSHPNLPSNRPRVVLVRSILGFTQWMP